MISSQINLLEKELTKLADKINLANSLPNSTDDVAMLTSEYVAIKKTLAKYRVQEFEEREYLDFDSDHR